ncbi:hypothetical protein F751_3283 [Auxenochlorella protothecoides]|uniref:Nuclear pore complex protein Nup205 n=1 Tax=Auxenochlorella protothecoides TaxID=3075 RepID=A0A087SRX2_AUXPR|nr:hypothetical protein F751_3283 [Auxenochlorella protothecoides]KFM28476.1 hypothetical protein F751_3283 [Auxenochlorella protothecoides]
MGDVPSLALIWEQTAPNPTSRAEIESCNPRTPFGTVQLDRLPDVEQILLLADEFKIDELEALNLIQRGYEQVGEVSAAAGAGQLVEARSSAIQTLFAVLEALSTGTPPPSWVPAADIDYVRERLDRGQPCQDLAALLLQRLASPAIPAPADGSRLVSLVNSAGQAAERSLAAAQEDLLLCQCLSLTLTLLSSQAEPPAKHLPQLLQLLRGSIDAKERAHAFVPLLLCTLYVLVPCVDDPEGMGAQLRSLRFDKQLDEAVAALPDPTCSSVKIAVSQAAVSHGALAFLRHGVLLSAVVTDGPALLAAGAARLAHGLVCALLGTPEGQGVLTGLTQASLANSQAEFERPDDLASLLDLLGATVRAAPELFLDEGLRQEEFTDLMGPYFARTQVLARVPSVFVAYHGVLAALAASPDGARSIFVQLGAEHNNGAVGWRQVFGGLVQVIQRYAPAPQQQGSGGAAPQKQPEEELPPWDSAGFAVMSHAPAAETALWLVQLTEELGLGPVWEVLIQCMCSPVPQELKAALNAALAALARLPEVAPAILSSLLPAVARAERYEETLSFTRLANVLWRSLGPVSAQGMDAVSDFIVATVLSSVFQRSYRRVLMHGRTDVLELEAQKWELAEAGLEHASLVLGRDSPAPVSSGGGGQAQAILRDLAGERGVYRTLWSVLEGGVRTLVDARSAAHGRARERATLAALRFLSAALDARDRDAAGAAADTLLRHGRARLPALLGLAAYPLDARLAAAAALHAADAAVGLHREALKLLLRTLLGDAGSVARGLLESLGSETTAPASALSDAPPKLQHLVQALGLADALSAAPCHAVLEGLAAEVAGDTGVVVVDLFALKSDLLHRFDEAVAAGAGSVEDTRAAFQLILRHAQQHNAWAEEASARAFLAGAWRDAIVASLEALLRALGAAHAAPRVRTPLWAALSSLLALVTPPEELAVPGPVLQIVMDGDDVAAADVLAEADAVFGAPCESMLRTLRSSRTMLACLVGDAASPDTVQASTALSLLATAVRVDAAGTVADVVHAQGLPQRMLQDLAHLPHAAILEPTNARGVVAEAALNLLLALALSGVDREAHAANAERLLEAQLLPSLARCEALATHPETLADPLHARLHGLLAPALRLALAVDTSLPQSPAARGALLVFLRARAAVLTRVALDAGRDGGRRGVGARELEQAALVVGLAGWVPGLLAEDPALQGAVYRMLYRFLCTDEASDSLAVARLRALRESGDGADEAAALADRILALRCALAVTGDIPDALTSAAPADRDGAMSLAEVGSTLGTLGRLHRLTFLVEHLLGVLLFQLRGRAAGNDPGLEQLGRTLEPLLLQLEQMAGDSLAPARRLQDLRLLVRRVKEAAAPPV